MEEIVLYENNGEPVTDHGLTFDSIEARTNVQSYLLLYTTGELALDDALRNAYLQGQYDLKKVLGSASELD